MSPAQDGDGGCLHLRTLNKREVTDTVVLLVWYVLVPVTTIHSFSNYSRYVLDTYTLSRLTAFKIKTLIIAWLARLELSLVPYLAQSFTGNYSA